MTATKENFSSAKTNHYYEIFLYFIRLGVLGFGGPFAVLAALQKELVEKRKWTSSEDFARAVALIKALPGPIATQLAIYLGYVRAGRIGGLLAGVCLIFPAFCMMIGIAAFYNTAEQLTWLHPALFGMQAAAIGMIADSIWRLARPYKTDVYFAGVALVALLLTFWRPSFEPVIIVSAGLLGIFWTQISSQGSQDPVKRWAIVPPILLSVGAPVSLLTQLSAISFKAGAFVFGSGLAIIPLLSHDVVDRYHWLTQQQFMDALAFGQITPGPVVITVTFVGYKVAGLAGACVATLGIFAPSFINMLTWFPIAERKLNGSTHTKHFVKFALAAVVGSLVLATIRLTYSTLESSSIESQGKFIGLTLLALLAAQKTKLPVWMIIPLGGILSLAAPGLENFIN